MGDRVDTKTVTLAGQEYRAYHYPDWNIWYFTRPPSGWLPVTEMAPRYGVPRDKLMRWAYAKQVPAFRIDVGDRFTWYVAPPAPDYVPPPPPEPPAPLTVADDLTGLPARLRNPLHRARLDTRAAVAALSTAQLADIRGITEDSARIIRAAVPYNPPPAPPIATPPGSQTYQIDCPCCHGSGKLTVTIPASAPEITQVLDT